VLLATRRRPVKIVAFRGTIGNLEAFQPAAWLGFFHPRVDRIVCPSRAVERYLRNLRMLGRRIPSEKIVTIHKGHDPEWYRGPGVDLADLGVPRGAFAACFSGRDRPHKGVDVLVDAVSRLDAKRGIHVLLVGPLEANRGLAQRIANSPARGRIHLTGFRADAAAIAGASDVFVLPSIGREGLSRAVFEAMAQGTPALVTNVGGLPEQVEHGVSGLVVPRSDPAALAAALVRVHDDRERTREMGRNALRRVREVFPLERTVRETIAVYEALTEGRLEPPSGSVGESAVGTTELLRWS